MNYLKSEKCTALKSPIFVIGNPRSGTTLLRLMLTNHSNIVIPPECGFAVWLKNKYASWHARQTDEFITDVVKSRKFSFWKLSQAQLKSYFIQNVPRSYADAVANVYHCYAEQQSEDYSRWGDKNNYHVGHVADIAEIFPEAIFVYIIRDGRDVACSYRDMKLLSKKTEYAPHLPEQIDVIASEWSGNSQKVTTAFQKIPSTQHYTLRYEDLVLSPLPTLKALCNFLSEEFEPQMLEYHTKAADLVPKEMMLWKARNQTPITAARVARYKAELSDKEILAFERIAGSVLQINGYKLLNQNI